MKIFSAAQIKACDAYTIHATGITTADLIERAASRCAEWIMQHLAKETLFIILCGPGNNGKDGLVLSRFLHHQGYGVKTFILQTSEDEQESAALKRSYPHAEVLLRDTYITDIPENIIIIDAILGIGLSRPVDGWISNLIQHLNELPNRKIAIDIPSGMPADTIPDNNAIILKANDTLSFQFYKRSFLHPETGKYAGNIHILDINLHHTFINSTHSSYQIIDEELIKNIYRPRKNFSHKGTYGTALLVGGSYGLIGAITLAAKAASRAGAGRVRTLLPECGYAIIQTAVPEAMCTTRGEKHVDRIEGWQEADAIGIGPGMGIKDNTRRAIADFLDECKKPVLMDADALNVLGKYPELLKKLPAGSILTPHPKEFERLFNATGNSMQRLEHARTQAMKYNIYIVLKDRYTAIVTPEGECWYNTAGNAGLATGGSGDVLAGIITGLMAQTYDSFEAALLGVYLHALAGEIASEKHSQEAVIPGDILDSIGQAYQKVKNSI
jgi:NAD(P)H-hydrate epimerase